MRNISLNAFGECFEVEISLAAMNGEKNILFIAVHLAQFSNLLTTCTQTHVHNIYINYSEKEKKPQAKID